MSEETTTDNGVSSVTQAKTVIRDTCVSCGNDKNLKRGWTNCFYCSESCERSHVSDIHASMPGAGPVPRRNWVPHHIGIEISRRWE